MSLTTSRLLCAAALGLALAAARATDVPKDSPFAQAGSAATASSGESLEFAGVSTVGKKTMINLYDKEEKRTFWVEAGATSSGVTVVNYDMAKDQITVRRNGVEKVLPLRAARGVVNAPMTAVPTPAAVAVAPAPAAPPTAAPAAMPMTGLASSPAPLGNTTPPVTGTAPAAQGQLSQARQEEEARMLVSDLLEIGMAQRKAYEEAQRRAASGQTQQTPATGAQPATAAPQPAQPTSTSTPSA